MGVVYKLTPEVKEFILKEKQADPNLGCRKLASLVLDKFQEKVSKSSINSLLKETGLSMPVGRRRKARRGIVETEGLGGIFLKAADSLLGGSLAISEAIKGQISGSPKDILAKTKALLYAPLFASSDNLQFKPDSGLWALLNQRFSHEEMLAYLNELQQVKGLSAEISQAISDIAQEAHCFKITTSSNAQFYLDGQLHTVWSTANIPFNFSVPVRDARKRLKEHLKDNEPWLLLMAPGYDKPTKEFFEFLSGVENREKHIMQITLLDNQSGILENVQSGQNSQGFFIFGLWPWQFTALRKVKTISEFRPFYFDILKEELFIADIEVELTQPDINQTLTLRGLSLKRVAEDKIRLMVLSNYNQDKAAQELVEAYLSHWPNLEDSFRDYGRKVELFARAAGPKRIFSSENAFLKAGLNEGIVELFRRYLKLLDAYVRWYFLPAGYENKDFSTLKEQFYSLAGRIKRHKHYIAAAFEPSPNSPALADLAYACHRVNERTVVLDEGKRLWLAP
jgi:hypothetical protein